MAKRLKLKKFLAPGLLVLGLALVGAQCPQEGVDLDAAPAATGATVSGVTVLEDNRIEISGNAFLEGYPYRLEGPLRIVVDINYANLGGDVPREQSGSGAISRVEAKILHEVDIPMVRVIAYVDQDVTYKMDEKINKLILMLEPSEAAGLMPVEEEVTPMPFDETKEELERLLAGAPPRYITTEMPYKEQAAGSGGLGEYAHATGSLRPLLGDMPPPKMDGSASEVHDVFYRISDEGIQIMILTNGPVTDFLDFDLPSPPKIVVDFWGMSAGTSKRVFPIAWAGVRQVRLGVHHDKIRAVVDLRGGLPAYDVKKTGSGVVVTILKKEKYTPGGVSVKRYTTGPGDSLRTIAQREYGNANNWPRLISANRNIFTRTELETIRKNNGHGEIGQGLTIRVPVR
jgi:type IV pilus assembly protein PilQ